MRADEQAVHYQTQNIESYKDTIQNAQNTKKGLEKNISRAESDIADTTEVVAILKKPEAFDICNTEGIRYKFEIDPAYIALDRKNRIEKLERNIERLQDEVEEMKNGLTRCDDKVAKAQEDIATAEKIIKESTERLGDENELQEE